jgi:hypothetical protein
MVPARVQQHQENRVVKIYILDEHLKHTCCFFMVVELGLENKVLRREREELQNA